jgi:hypothetical protein
MFNLLSILRNDRPSIIQSAERIANGRDQYFPLGSYRRSGPRCAPDRVGRQQVGEAMTAPLHPSSGTAEAVAYCGWHPEHGYALQTCGHDQQHAASLLMRTDLAGNHGWSVQPLYAALSPTPQTAGGAREAIAEWLLRDRGLKDASIEAIKEYRGETYLKALDDADEILALSPQAQAGETYSGQTATNIGATFEVVGTITTPAQASTGPREVLDALADKVSAKIAQLEHYKANDAQLDHAKTIAEGRISQANQILHWIAEQAIQHSPSVPSTPDGGAA